MNLFNNEINKIKIIKLSFDYFFLNLFDFK